MGNYSPNSDGYSNGINGIPGMKPDTQHEISVPQTDLCIQYIYLGMKLKYIESGALRDVLLAKCIRICLLFEYFANSKDYRGCFVTEQQIAREVGY